MDFFANIIEKYFLILEDMSEVKIKFYHVLQSKIKKKFKNLYKNNTKKL